ncbi:MAG: FKBP-type peptidyl-prolyl cis-trans isomerase [Candidatus Eisenbacteria bacterium]
MRSAFSLLVVVALLGCGGAQKSDHGAGASGAQPSPAATKPADSAKSEKGGTVVTTPSGLKYEELVVGTGATPVKGQKVTVHYTGWLTDGSKFDSSRDSGRPYVTAIGVGAVIAGWDEGILTMKVGGKRKFTVPPGLAYGAAGRPPVIPPNSTLVFEVELLGVQ